MNVLEGCNQGRTDGEFRCLVFEGASPPPAPPCPPGVTLAAKFLGLLERFRLIFQGF